MSKSFFKTAFCLLLISIPILGVHENPLNVVKILFSSAFGSAGDFSLTLLYFAPLLLSATAIHLALSNGLYNIGAEGQLYMGSCFGIAAGIFFSNKLGSSSSIVTSLFYLLCCLLSCFIGGAFWGGIVGLLRAYKNVHEVISSILLNFIAYAFSNWVVLSVFKNQETQASETLGIASQLQIPQLWRQTPESVLMAIVVCVCVVFFLKKTWGGFRIQAVGQNPIASAEAGINPKMSIFLVMVFSGGISGLIGFHEIFCHSYKLIDGFSSGFGFTGLAIALAAQGQTSLLFIFSFLFSVLAKGALDLEIETENITRDLSLLIQALILISLAIPSHYFELKRKLTGKEIS